MRAAAGRLEERCDDAGRRDCSVKDGAVGRHGARARLAGSCMTRRGSGMPAPVPKERTATEQPVPHPREAWPPQPVRHHECDVRYSAHPEPWQVANSLAFAFRRY
jgi:hypothetical protein